MGNSGTGVDIFTPNNNVIGGTNSGEGNVIAFNGGVGVRLAIGTNNPIQGNSIFSNGGLGIDLDTAGVSLNDLGDLDTGANNLQNFPEITSVVESSGSVHIVGTLDSLPSARLSPRVFWQ